MTRGKKISDIFFRKQFGLKPSADKLVFKKYKVNVFSPTNKLVREFFCNYIDSCRSKTIFSECEIKQFKGELHLTEGLICFNAFYGLTTLYYDSGAFVEITKLI